MFSVGEVATRVFGPPRLERDGTEEWRVIYRESSAQNTLACLVQYAFANSEYHSIMNASQGSFQLGQWRCYLFTAGRLADLHVQIAYLPWRCSYFLNDHLTFKSLAYKGSQRTEPSLQNENKSERERFC
jgi:hypothetical protein